MECSVLQISLYLVSGSSKTEGLRVESTSKPFYHLLILLISRILEHIEQMAIAANSTTILWRTGTTSLQQLYFHHFVIIYGLLLYQSYLMNPAVSEVIFPFYLTFHPAQQATYRTFTSILLHAYYPGIIARFCIISLTSYKLVEMIAFPTHCPNQDFT